jgi:hypothetical protein
MIRDFMIWVAEGLFWLTDGVMLMNTAWVLVWILVWSLVMASPMFYLTHVNYNRKPPGWPGFVFLFGFFPGLLMAAGPGIVQIDMMTECKTLEVETADVILNGEIVNLGSIPLKHCRTKENYYSEFGEWKIRNNS